MMGERAVELVERSREETVTRRRHTVLLTITAFADKHVYARNDEELVCASLAK